MRKWLMPAVRDIVAAALPVIVARLLAAIAERPPGDDPQGALPLDVPAVAPSASSSNRPVSPVPPASAPPK